MWTFAIVVVAALLAIAWLPVGAHFWRSWRARGSPVSLAICGVVGFQIYLSSSTWLFMKNDPRWVATVMLLGNLLTLANFYLCFRWQRKRFPDARKNLDDARADTDPY